MLWLGYSSVNIDWSDRIFYRTIHSMLDTIYTMTYRAPVGANKSELGVVSYYWWWLSVPMVGRKSREGSLLAGDATTGSQVGESAFPPSWSPCHWHTHTSLALCFVCRYSPHTVVLALLSSWQMTWPADGEKCFPRWWCSACATTVTPWLTCQGKDISVDVVFAWVRLG